MALADILRAEAISLFQNLKSFLTELWQGRNDVQQVDYLLTNLSDEQVKCLFLILFFISKKEIPLLPEGRLKLKSSQLSQLLKVDSNLLDDLQAMHHFVLSFRNAIASLVEPILVSHA